MEYLSPELRKLIFYKRKLFPVRFLDKVQNKVFLVMATAFTFGEILNLLIPAIWGGEVSFWVKCAQEGNWLWLEAVQELGG